jgi:hypothetical protein
MNTEQASNSVQPVGKAIAAAFVKAQTAFGPALKTADNGHFKSKYADLAACVEAVIDALNQNGIALIQRNLPCESGVTVETVFVHVSGETLTSGPLHVPASKQDPQGYGSALTYARRYSLMSACGIAPEDDDGNAASASAPRSTPKTGITYTAKQSATPRTTDLPPKAAKAKTEAAPSPEDDDGLPF